MTLSCPSALAALTRASMPPADSALVAVFQSVSPSEPAVAELVAEHPARGTIAAAARATPARVRLCCTGCAFRVLRVLREFGPGFGFWMIVDAPGFRPVLRW